MSRAGSRGLGMALLAVGIMLLPGVTAALPLVTGSGGPMAASITKDYTYNWAGYLTTAANKTVTKASATWIEPAVKCTSGTQYALFWVGMDGVLSSTVEQIGTFAYCSGGSPSYYAWWEFYPANDIQVISTMTVHAGDKIVASVAFASNKFTLKIVDGSQSFTEKGTQSGVERSSAECIVERPAITSGGVTSLSYLANFGVMKFSSCAATISGTSGGIGTFSAVGEVTMLSQLKGQATLAAPSALGSSKSSFSVTWKKAN